MKTLLLMRHAKSSWDDPKLKDIERPLHKRGKKDAPKMGKLLRKKGLTPNVILSSTAVRARETAEAVADKSHFEGQVEYLDAFYMSEADAYIARLSTLPAEVDKALVIGHNPGLESLMQILSGKIESLSTAAVAYLELPIDQWTELTDQVQGKLAKLWDPSEID